jgi:hypothetical protein
MALIVVAPSTAPAASPAMRTSDSLGGSRRSHMGVVRGSETGLLSCGRRAHSRRCMMQWIRTKLGPADARTASAKWPEGLDATCEMLSCAYPDGVPADEYQPLLRVLAEHMSQRQLASAIYACFGGDDATIANDVLGRYEYAVSDEAEQHVVSRLMAFGFEAWRRNG